MFSPKGKEKRISAIAHERLIPGDIDSPRFTRTSFLTCKSRRNAALVNCLILQQTRKKIDKEQTRFHIARIKILMDWAITHDQQEK